MAGGAARLDALRGFERIHPDPKDATPFERALTRPLPDAAKRLLATSRRYDRAYGPSATPVDPALKDPTAPAPTDGPEPPYLSQEEFAAFGVGHPDYRRSETVRADAIDRAPSASRFEAAELAVQAAEAAETAEDQPQTAIPAGGDVTDGQDGLLHFAQAGGGDAASPHAPDAAEVDPYPAPVPDPGAFADPYDLSGDQATGPHRPSTTLDWAQQFDLDGFEHRLDEFAEAEGGWIDGFFAAPDDAAAEDAENTADLTPDARRRYEALGEAIDALDLGRPLTPDEAATLDELAWYVDALANREFDTVDLDALADLFEAAPAEAQALLLSALDDRLRGRRHARPAAEVVGLADPAAVRAEDLSPDDRRRLEALNRALLTLDADGAASGDDARAVRALLGAVSQTVRFGQDLDRSAVAALYAALSPEMQARLRAEQLVENALDARSGSFDALGRNAWWRALENGARATTAGAMNALRLAELTRAGGVLRVTAPDGTVTERYVSAEEARAAVADALTPSLQGVLETIGGIPEAAYDLLTVDPAREAERRALRAAYLRGEIDADELLAELTAAEERFLSEDASDIGTVLSVVPAARATGVVARGAARAPSGVLSAASAAGGGDAADAELGLEEADDADDHEDWDDGDWSFSSAGDAVAGAAVEGVGGRGRRGRDRSASDDTPSPIDPGDIQRVRDEQADRLLQSGLYERRGDYIILREAGERREHGADTTSTEETAPSVGPELARGDGVDLTDAQFARLRDDASVLNSMSDVDFRHFMETLTDADLQRIFPSARSRRPTPDTYRLRRRIFARIRRVGGEHEWLMVSQYPNLRLLGYTIDDIRSPDWRTPTEAVFVNPENPQELFRHYDASGRSSRSTPDGFVDRGRARRLSGLMHSEIEQAIATALSELERTGDLRSVRIDFEREMDRIRRRWLLQRRR